MIANVTLTARVAPIFYGKIDLRLLIKAVKREGICTLYILQALSGWYHYVLSQRFWKCSDPHSMCIWCGNCNSYSSTVRQVCCAIKKKLVADYIRENYCFQVQSPEAPYLLSLATFVGIFKLSTHGGLRASLSAFCDISFLTSFLIPSPLTTRVHMTSKSRRAYSTDNFIMECYWSFQVIVTGTNTNEPTRNLMFWLFPGVIGPFIVEKSFMACISRRLRKTGTGLFMHVRLKTADLQKQPLV